MADIDINLLVKRNALDGDMTLVIGADGELALVVEGVIVVEPTPDTVNPVVVAPTAITIEYVNGGAGLAHDDSALLAWLSTASATDDVDGAVAVTNNLATFSNPLTTNTLFTFTATDAAGNQGTNQVTLSVTEEGDTINPVVIAPDDQSLSYVFGGAGVTHASIVGLMATASATDNVDGVVTVTNNLNLLPDPLVESVVVITFTATDAAGNQGTDTTTLTITEDQEPLIGTELAEITNIEVL
jgi:hypothetical protein